MALASARSFVPLLVTLKYLLCTSQLAKDLDLTDNHWNSEAKQYSDDQLLRLSHLTKQDNQQFIETLDKLAIPRVVGTDGHTSVRQYITDSLEALDWTVEYDAFNERTPYGQKTFTNIVATLNKKACKRLVLSCHYDSKLSQSGRFVGATDSAVPCTMILEIVKSLDPLLKAHKLSSISDTTLQLIFFDGEEAFGKWTDEDSLYGSRHLANAWERNKFLTAESETRLCGHLSDMRTELDRIEVMVLLDLLGAKDPVFLSQYTNTNALHTRLVSIEQELNELGLMESGRRSESQYFKNVLSRFGVIADDHVPFLRRGVPILHVIPIPFPDVWHKDSDTKDNIHFPTVKNLFKIFKIFVAQYLHLELD